MLSFQLHHCQGLLQSKSKHAVQAQRVHIANWGKRLCTIARQAETGQNWEGPIHQSKCLGNRALKPKTHIVSYQHALLLNILRRYVLFWCSQCSAQRLASATGNTQNPNKQKMLETCSAGNHWHERECCLRYMACQLAYSLTKYQKSYWLFTVLHSQPYCNSLVTWEASCD